MLRKREDRCVYFTSVPRLFGGTDALACPLRQVTGEGEPERVLKWDIINKGEESEIKKRRTSKKRKISLQLYPSNSSLTEMVVEESWAALLRRSKGQRVHDRS